MSNKEEHSGVSLLRILSSLATSTLLSVVVLGVMTTGCASAPKDKGYVIPNSIEVKMDERLMADCSDLPLLAGPTDEEVAAWAQSVILNQADCRSRKNKQTVIIRELLNQKQSTVKTK